MQRVTIPLGSLQSMRRVMVFLGAALLVVTALVAVGAFALLNSGIPFVSDGSLLEGVVGAVLVAGCGGLWVWPKLSPWLGWQHEPALVIEPDFLTVRHPGFGEPLVVPRQLIQVASVDTTSWGLLGAHRRFRVTTGSPAESARGRSVLASREVARLHLWSPPNIVVLFKQSLPTAPSSRGVRWGEHAFFRGGRDLRGVALHVGDPDQARAELARVGLLRAIRFEDLAASGLALTRH